jgi:tetratricopeptide (TPR) repeat protein
MANRSRLALMMCVGLAAGFGSVTPSSAEGLGAQSARINALGSAGKYSEAIPLAEAMLAELEKGPQTRDLAGALNNLAQLYGDVGRDAEAEPMFERAIAMMEKSVGLDSVDIAPELNNLAALYQRQQRYSEAEPLFKRRCRCQRSSYRQLIPISVAPSTISPPTMRSRAATRSPKR